jgi:hypothetical protein
MCIQAIGEPLSHSVGTPVQPRWAALWPAGRFLAGPNWKEHGFFLKKCWTPPPAFRKLDKHLVGQAPIAICSVPAMSTYGKVIKINKTCDQCRQRKVRCIGEQNS